MLTNLHKLVNCTHACKNRIIAETYVPCHLSIVTHDAIISNYTIVSNVAVCHNQTIISNLGCPFIFTSSIDGYKFPDGGIVTNNNRGVFSFILQVLWNPCKNGSWENATIISNPGAFHDSNITSNPGTASNFYILVYYTEWINFYIRC